MKQHTIEYQVADVLANVMSCASVMHQVYCTVKKTKYKYNMAENVTKISDDSLLLITLKFLPEIKTITIFN